MEIEVKIKIKDIEELKSRLLALGTILTKGRYQEDNTLYDFPSAGLYKRRCALRLRAENKKTFLTFKGPPLKSRKFKIRQEYETEVKNRKQNFYSRRASMQSVNVNVQISDNRGRKD